MSGLDGFDGGVSDRDADILDMTGARMMRKSPLLEEAWRYWSSLRSGRNLPRRDALDPRAMSLTLGHSMILDRVRPGTVRVRLGGRVMNSLMGMEVRGLPVRAFFEVAQRDRAIDLVEQVFEAPATLELDMVSQTDSGLTHGRMLILPLQDRTGAVTKAISCLALDRFDPEPPHRFSILRERLHVLKSDRNSAFARLGAAHLSQEVTGLPMELAEGTTPYAAGPSPRPYLRVVK
ncbi:PAS domain-containing protein [Jannaschia sp. M317]|uniref:PAS domain-containing protein n=1 Tax=Jannaschia sp. M317 TaxID=2867011 RepID=UPI0021A70088|nr:PAS domain-containing protein [Jannaschia sp. M317]UWQ16543.1 PAS domain-containing protein [Jannaschia sp. M317]